jgi:gas vesicle protein
MSRNNHNGKKGFLIGMFCGGIVGSITALLLAPKSGEKTRREIAKKYQCISDKTCELVDGVCEKTYELVEKAKDIAQSAKDAACKIYRKD